MCKNDDAATFVVTIAGSAGSIAPLIRVLGGLPARTHFDRVVLGMTPDEVARFWIDRRIRGRGSPPTKAPKAATVLKVVAALAGAIGYVPQSQVGPGVKVVARVAQDKVIPEGRGASR